MKKILLAALLASATISLFAQTNVGIGTNTPTTKLQVAGAISATTSSAAAASTVVIPDNVTNFDLTAGSGPSTLSVAHPQDGQYLFIQNDDANQATFTTGASSSVVIPAGGMASFLYLAADLKWQEIATNNTGSNAFTAGTGLGWSGTTLNSSWTQSGNNLYNNNSGSVGINNPSPNPSAVLDIASTTQGMLPPRMTTAQRNNINVTNTAAVQGLTIFNITTNCLESFIGTTWQPIGCGCTSAPAAPGAISGTASVCTPINSVGYSIPAVAGASSYTWTVPTNAVIATGTGTTFITVNYPTNTVSGNISVTANNSCGTSAASSALSVTASVTSIAPTSLNSSVTICNGQSTTLTQTGGSLGTNAYWQWYTDNLYTLPIGGQLTSANASLTVSPSTTTSYYLRVEGTASPCTTILPGPSAGITVTVTPLPAIPTAVTANPGSICVGSASNLNATSTAGSTINWYTVATGGTSVGSSSTGTNFAVSPTTSTIYYAEGFETACASSSRTPIAVNVVALPATPTAVTATPATICAGQSSNLKGTSSGNTIDWFTAASGGTALGASASGANYAASPAASTTYYAEAESPAGPPSYTFTNCGATYTTGPTQAQANTAYTGTSLAGLVTISGSGIQLWTVPVTGSYVITVKGASGGSTTYAGYGASVTGTLQLTAGTQLSILVGQMGSSFATNYSDGGGGGSFVAAGSTLYFAAGGGGGSAQVGNISNAQNAATSTSVVNSSATEFGSAGAGYSANGSNFTYGSYNTVAQSFTNGGLGQVGGEAGGWPGTPYGDGGFGGGGSSCSCSTGGGGGGGGYAGGGGGSNAGYNSGYGGSSYITSSASNTSSSVLSAYGNGSVVISTAVTSCPSPSRTSVSVTVNPLPSITSITPGTSPLCLGGTTTLTANPTGGSGTYSNYAWSSSTTGNGMAASTTASNSATPTSTGTQTYTVKVTDNNNCTSSAAGSVSITVNPDPTITSTGTATAVCTNASTQTTVLPYTATTNSPISYSIVWNSGIANQASTAYTFVAGSGSMPGIIVPGGTGAGTYTGTVTITTANGCTATHAISLTVNLTPTITSAGIATAVCASSSAQTTVLPYTATTGSPTSYSIAWTGIANQASTAYTFVAGGGNMPSIAIPANTAAGTYNGTLTITNASSCTNTQAISVTVNPLPTVTVAAGTNPFCLGGSTTLTATPAAGSGTYSSYAWSSSTTGNGMAASTTASNSATPTTAATQTYTVKVTDNNNCTSSAAGSVSITVNALPTITSTGTVTAVCYNSSAQTTVLPYTATTNSPTSYAITWSGAANTAGLTNQSSTSYTFVAGSGSMPGIVIPAGVAAGTYTGTLTVTNANTCSNATPLAISLTINPLPTITTVGTATAVCASSSAQTTLLPYTATTGSPTSYSIVWTGITNQTSTAYTFVAGGSNMPSIAIPANTAANTYNGTLTITTAAGCAANPTQPISVTVNPLPSITSITPGTSPLCLGGTTTLTANPTGGSGTYSSYAWSSSTTGNGMAASTTASNSATPTTAATQTYTVKVTDNNNCTSSAAGSVSITVNALPTITSTGTVTAVCYNSSAQTTVLPYTATTNSPTSYAITWSGAANTAGLTNQSSTSYTFVAGSGSMPGIVIPAGVAAGTYTGTLTVTNANTCSNATPLAISLTINPLPTITTVGTATAVCASSSAQTTLLPYTATTGSPTSYSIVWTGITNQTSTAYTFVAGGSNMPSIAIPANTAANTYNGTLTITTAAGCAANPTQPISVTVNPLPSITSITPGTSPLCLGGTTTLTANPTGGSGTYTSYAWSSSTTGNGMAASTTASNSATPTTAATQTYTVKVTDNNNCTSSAAGSVSITVNALPTITSTGTVTAVCHSSSAQTTVLPYTATTNSPTSYAITWSGAANTAGLTNQGSTAYTFIAGGGSMPGIVIPAGVAAGTYTGTVTITNANTCSNATPLAISLTINPLPTITTTGTATAVCASSSAQTTLLPYTATTGSPTSYSIVWTGITNQTSTAYTFVAGGSNMPSIAIPANTAANTYNGTLTITTAAGCAANPTQPISVTVNPLPSITSITPGTSPLCLGGTTTLTANPTGGSGTYSSYAWSSSTTGNGMAASTTASNSATPTTAATQTYTVKVTDNNNCTSSAAGSVSITVNALPTITSTGTVTAVCYNSSAQTTVLPYTATTNSPTSYAITWSGAANTAGLTNQSSTSYTFVAGSGSMPGIVIPAGVAAGTYTGTLTVTNANTCSNATPLAISLTINPLPTITTTGTATAVCSSSSAQTTVLPYTAVTNSPTSYSIVWTGIANQTSTSYVFIAGGGNMPSIAIPASTAANTYNGTLTITTAAGCAANPTQPISVTVIAAPTVTLAGTTICLNKTTNLTATVTGGSGTLATNPYAWSGNGIAGTPTSGNTNTAVPTTTGSLAYTVTVSDADGCNVSATTNVTVNTLPATTATTNAVFSTNICQGTSLILTGGPAGMSTYAWSGPSTYTSASQSPTVSTSATTAMAGAYTLVATNSNGCSASATTNTIAVGYGTNNIDAMNGELGTPYTFTTTHPNEIIFTEFCGYSRTSAPVYNIGGTAITSFYNEVVGNYEMYLYASNAASAAAYTYTFTTNDGIWTNSNFSVYNTYGCPLTTSNVHFGTVSNTTAATVNSATTSAIVPTGSFLAAATDITVSANGALTWTSSPNTGILNIETTTDSDLHDAGTAGVTVTSGGTTQTITVLDSKQTAAQNFLQPFWVQYP